MWSGKDGDRMQEMILLKLGEIALKGLNRRSFEEVLKIGRASCRERV